MLQIKNNTNLDGPYLTIFASFTLTQLGATFSSPSRNKNLDFLHLMPDDFFKKIPKFGKFSMLKYASAVNLLGEVLDKSF
jgi:hypothetical protein